MSIDKLLYKARNLRALIGSAKVLVGSSVGGLFGATTAYGELSAVLQTKDGSVIDYGVVSRRVVTDAGVAFLVDDWDAGTTSIANFNYHDSGTGTTAEAAAQTTLVTQAGPTTRATGSKSQPSANIIRSVGTIAYTGTLAITEHGLFSQAAQGGTLWDRSVFAAINVGDGDSIQFTYSCTFTAGS